MKTKQSNREAKVNHKMLMIKILRLLYYFVHKQKIIKLKWLLIEHCFIMLFEKSK